jgi:hypothetical protein
LNFYSFLLFQCFSQLSDAVFSCVEWPEDAKIEKPQKAEKAKESEVAVGEKEMQPDDGAKPTEEPANHAGQAESNEPDGSTTTATTTTAAGETKEDENLDLSEEEEDNNVRYSRVILNGVTYSVGDTVALWPPSRRKGAPMGTIKCLLTNGNDNNMEIEWFYRAEETILKGNRYVIALLLFFSFSSLRRTKVPEREVFLSSHIDLNAIESIQKKVSVKWDREIADLDEYIKEPDCYYYKKKYDYKNKCFKDL